MAKEKDILRSVKFLMGFIFWAGLATAVWLLLIPKEAENAVFLGYSLKRLALLFPLLLPAICALLIQSAAAKKDSFILKNLNKTRSVSFLLAVGSLSALFAWSAIVLLPNLLPSYIRFPDMGLYVRLLPIFVYYLLIGLGIMVFVPLGLYPTGDKRNKRQNFPIKTFAITAGIMLATFAVIEFTGLGKDPARISIISLGVPLMEGQIWYIIGLLVLGLIGAYAWSVIPEQGRSKIGIHKDLWVAIIIWLAAVALWMSLPLPTNNYFAPTVRAPNNEVYPFSDAEQYDYNSLYVYYGALEDFVISKPFYVTLLAILHALGGMDYARIIFLQTMIVAFFPVVLYQIGRELHTRFGGIAVAVFAILREVSAIQATDIANVSNTKLLLSDMLAALLVSLLVLVMIRWFKNREKKICGHEFLIGGLLGILILTRIQTMALVPLLLLLAVVRNWGSLKKVVFSALLLILAVGLIVTPVLLRNHSITGVYWVDNPASSKNLYTFFINSGDYEIDIPEAETNQEMLDRNLSVITTLFVEQFGDIMKSTMDGFLRNEMSSMLVMPVRLGNKIPLKDYFVMRDPFWAEVYTQANLINLLVVLTNITLVALGFAAAYKRYPRAVLVTVVLHLAYSLSSAIVHLSGWRFILPVDWTIYMFYAFGLTEVIRYLFHRISNWNFDTQIPWLLSEAEIPDKGKMHWQTYTAAGILFLFIGAFIPARENLFPANLPQYDKEKVCRSIQEALDESDRLEPGLDFQDFCESENTIALEGYGFYPRIFGENDGYYDRSYDPYFGKQPYTRLTFRLIGKDNEKVYIKTDDLDLKFPNGNPVIVVGRQNRKFEAQFVLIEGDEPQLVISTDILSGEDQLKENVD